MQDLVARKRELRRVVRRLRSAAGWDAAMASRIGARIAEHLERTPEFGAAQRVALFAPLPDEVDTRCVFEGLQCAAKRCLLPRTVRGDDLEFAPVSAWEELRVGRYGVLEPEPDRPAVEFGHIDLVLVPGVAFDAAGGRLGRGRGCYDRAFGAAKPGAPVLFGLAAEFQVVDAVPRGSQDRSVDAIITEEGVRRAVVGARADE